MFAFDPVNDIDLDYYEYQLRQSSTSGTLVNAKTSTDGTTQISGTAKANVFTVSVTNSTSSSNIDYYGRVRTVSTSGARSAWSAYDGSGDTPLIASQYIQSLTADQIESGTIGAHTITLGGNTSVIKSSTYNGSWNGTQWTTGSAGWLISGNGQAIFDATQIRGSVSAGSINLNTHNYWLPSGSTATFKVGSSSQYLLFDGTNVSFSGSLSAASGTFTGSLSAASGTFTGRLEVGDVDIGNDVGPGTGHYGISLSTTDFNNIFLRRSDGIYFFRVGNGGSNSITWDSQSGTLNVTGTISASSGTIGGFTLSSSKLSATSGFAGFGQYAEININSSGLIESYYSDVGFVSSFYERVKINNYAAGGSGAINVSGTASGGFSERWYTSYGVYNPSDIRLKNLIEQDVDALSMIENIQTTKFTLKSDESQREHFGFIAQQINDCVPHVAVPGGEDPEKKPWGIVQENLIPYLVKSIQQLSAKVDELESRLV